MARKTKAQTAPETTDVATPVVEAASVQESRNRVANEPEAHGIKRPSEGTATRAVWTLIDSMVNADNEIPTRSAVILAAGENGMNTSTASTQYGKYRVFHGLGKEIKPTTTKATETAKAPPPEPVHEAVEEEEPIGEDVTAHFMDPEEDSDGDEEEEV